MPWCRCTPCTRRQRYYDGDAHQLAREEAETRRLKLVAASEKESAYRQSLEAAAAAAEIDEAFVAATVATERENQGTKANRVDEVATLLSHPPYPVEIFPAARARVQLYCVLGKSPQIQQNSACTT